MEVQIPLERGNYKAGKEWPVVKYSDSAMNFAKKRRLEFGVGWAKGTMY